MIQFSVVAENFITDIATGEYFSFFTRNIRSHLYMDLLCLNVLINVLRMYTVYILLHYHTNSLSTPWVDYLPWSTSMCCDFHWDATSTVWCVHSTLPYHTADACWQIPVSGRHWLLIELCAQSTHVYSQWVDIGLFPVMVIESNKRAEYRRKSLQIKGNGKNCNFAALSSGDGILTVMCVAC